MVRFPTVQSRVGPLDAIGLTGRPPPRYFPSPRNSSIVVAFESSAQPLISPPLRLFNKPQVLCGCEFPLG